MTNGINWKRRDAGHYTSTHYELERFSADVWTIHFEAVYFIGTAPSLEAAKIKAQEHANTIASGGAR